MKKFFTFMVLCFALLQYSTTTICSAKSLPNSRKFEYNLFEKGNLDSSPFKFLGSSTIDQDALQLTPDNPNQDNGYVNKSGRVMYNQPYELWSSDNGDEIVSFQTFFVINLYQEESWDSGEGLAFLIAPDLNFPEPSYGQWLGLTNEKINGDPTNHIVAIEFDTEKQYFDPDDNHLGLNINSVISNKTAPLAEFGFNLSSEPKAKYSVWIDYNGGSKLMEVFMAKDVETKPQTPILIETINLKDHVKRVSYFGFAGSTGDLVKQFNCVLKWKLEVEVFRSGKDWKWLIVGFCVGFPLMVSLLVLFGIMFRRVYLKERRNRDEESNVLGTLKRLPGMPREFKYRDLKRATTNFHESMVLGKGGFGVVYKGVLLQDHDRSRNTSASATAATEIAVKKFSRDNINGKDDFLAELTIIHRLRHKHLVRLVGWCYEKGKLLLVYDYMPNGSVEKYLYKSSNQNTNTLNWRRRYKILAGVASALDYLHNNYDQKVVHRDLKASNILLDSDYNARLGDFGLARAIENERNSYADLELSGIPGTMGYVAPECFHTGKATLESDVFGFGAVVLEVVTGRSPGVKIQREHSQLTLVDWVWMLHREGRILEAVDERLNDEYDVEEANRLLLLGLACSHPIAGERPQTQAICQIITETLPPPSVPQFKPVFTWPSLISGDYNSSSADTSFSNI